MHWTIYTHLRLHSVAFVLTCASDSIWKNSKETWRYSLPPLLLCITLTVFSYGQAVLPFSPLNCLTIFSYEEPLLSMVMLSSLIRSQNSSNVTGVMDQLSAFSSLHLLKLCFWDTAWANSTSLMVDDKLLLSFCPHWVNQLWTAARVCTATLSLDLTLSPPFTAFSFWAPEGGSSSLEGFWDNSVCVHLWAFSGTLQCHYSLLFYQWMFSTFSEIFTSACGLEIQFYKQVRARGSTEGIHIE